MVWCAWQPASSLYTLLSSTQLSSTQLSSAARTTQVRVGAQATHAQKEFLTVALCTSGIMSWSRFTLMVRWWCCRQSNTHSVWS
jgi:hypothetical protein